MKKIGITLFLMSHFLFFGQEKEVEVFKKHHTLGFMLSHTNVSQGVNDGEKTWLSLPSFALDYNYVFSSKWSIGVHNDVIIEKFIVETNNSTELERSTPIASVAVIGYKPWEHFTLEVGLGGEFAKEENLALTRLGLEYSLEMGKDWEFISNFVYDIKWNAYDSFSIGVGVAKSLGK